MNRRVLILVEGQTEERFVKDVLLPVYGDRGIYFYPTLLTTKKVKDGSDFKGGVTNFAKFRNDVNRLLHGAGGALVTTMIDYYRLPGDFPGMNSRPNAKAIERVTHVEDRIAEYFDRPDNFVPFLALHEFEAWLFASPQELPLVMTDSEKQSLFAAVLKTVSSPEEINERPGWAPSERIRSIFPAYRKRLHGPLAAKRIGLPAIRQACPHFDDWLGKVERYAAA